MKGKFKINLVSSVHSSMVTYQIYHNHGEYAPYKHKNDGTALCDWFMVTCGYI